MSARDFTEFLLAVFAMGMLLGALLMALFTRYK
jgi:hypothetical protein